MAEIEKKELKEAASEEVAEVAEVVAKDTDRELSADEKLSESRKAEKETAADLLKDEVDLKIRKAKGSKNVSQGICHVLATFNNTKVTFSDLQGNVISWCSAGKCNFRGSRKSTAYASQVVTQTAGRAAMSHGLKEVVVKIKGPGMGRDSAVRAIQALGLIINSIIDTTPIPHNGCRPKKRRRA
jgi:small subunit ribosomal protein S11